jgi:hypothetical protein
MIGENVKMLCEQIEEEKGKITRMFLDEEIEISFWTPARRGQELADVQILVATQRLRHPLFGSGNDTPTSEGGEGTLYSGSGIDKIHDGKVSKSEAIYFQKRAYAERALI